MKYFLLDDATLRDWNYMGLPGNMTYFEVMIPFWLYDGVSLNSSCKSEFSLKKI